MEPDYITTSTKEWVFDLFLKMPDDEFALEMDALNSALRLYLSGIDVLVDSFVQEYLDDVSEIARDALVARFLTDHLPK